MKNLLIVLSFITILVSCNTNKSNNNKQLVTVKGEKVKVSKMQIICKNENTILNNSNNVSKVITINNINCYHRMTSNVLYGSIITIICNNMNDVVKLRKQLN